MKVLISGLINIETTVAVRGFPINYYPIDYPFFGVNSNVSGVGYNLAKAFSVLGDKSNIISYLGNDYEAERILKQLENDGISVEGISRTLKNTPVSVVLFDKEGKRQIYSDLKDIQDKLVDTENNIVENKISECDVVCACNINFNRKLIKKAKKMKKIVATDVHVLDSSEDDYNRDFMQNADILFLSDEKLPCEPKAFIQELHKKYHNKVIVIGMGNKGAMLFDGESYKTYTLSSAKCSKIVNTVGAGDALFSSFIHYYTKSMNCIDALKYAETFAAIKIGYNGASIGFSNENDVETALKYSEITVTEI